MRLPLYQLQHQQGYIWYELSQDICNRCHHVVTVSSVYAGQRHLQCLTTRPWKAPCTTPLHAGLSTCADLSSVICSRMEALKLWMQLTRRRPSSFMMPLTTLMVSTYNQLTNHAGNPYIYIPSPRNPCQIPIPLPSSTYEHLFNVFFAQHFQI